MRVLLDDNHATFEQALQERLVMQRESVGADPAARSLLPRRPRMRRRWPCCRR
ncbi:hypothetical protein OG385_01095 [Streptomyces sp. NBC_01306]|nr:hypothetical protein [Streptomyces sp. NBC_01306]